MVFGISRGRRSRKLKGLTAGCVTGYVRFEMVGRVLEVVRGLVSRK